MKDANCCLSKVRIIVIALVILFSGHTDVVAGGKVRLHLIHMVPAGNDAEDYSRPGWGIGGWLVLPLSPPLHVVAGVVGFEWINLLNETTTFQDRVTGLRVEQQTSQDYFRIVLGGQIGGHGEGFLRPYGGLNFAIINYGIFTDVVIPDDVNRENEIRQSLSSEVRWAVGYDITAGLDLNVSEDFTLDGGVRFLKTFSLVQQLGDGSETIYPGYVQIYLGVGIPF